jgi:hypothetical protein
MQRNSTCKGDEVEATDAAWALQQAQLFVQAMKSFDQPTQP